MPSRLHFSKIQGNVNVHPVIFAAEEGCQALTFLQLLRRLPFLPPPPHAAAGVVAVQAVAASARAGIRLLCFHLWTFLLLALLVAV